MGLKPRPRRNTPIGAAPLQAALDRADGNISEAARALGWSRVRVYRMLRRSGVVANESRQLARRQSQRRRNGRSSIVLGRLLEALDGNVTAVAHVLGTSRVHAHRLLGRVGLEAAPFRGGAAGAHTGASRLAEYVATRLRLRPRDATLRETRRQFEHVYALAALAVCGGDRQATARLLDISPSSLKEKLRPPSWSDN